MSSTTVAVSWFQPSYSLQSDILLPEYFLTWQFNFDSYTWNVILLAETFGFFYTVILLLTSSNSIYICLQQFYLAGFGQVDSMQSWHSAPSILSNSKIQFSNRFSHNTILSAEPYRLFFYAVILLLTSYNIIKGCCELMVLVTVLIYSLQEAMSFIEAIFPSPSQKHLE